MCLRLSLACLITAAAAVEEPPVSESHTQTHACMDSCMRSQRERGRAKDTQAREHISSSRSRSAAIAEQIRSPGNSWGGRVGGGSRVRIRIATTKGEGGRGREREKSVGSRGEQD